MSKSPRPPLPDLTDQDLEEIFGPPYRAPDLPTAVWKLWQVPREKLDATPWIERRWVCGAKDCQRDTAVRDYGHPSHFYWHRKWVRRDNHYYLCGRHSRLAKGYWTSDVHHRNLPFELKSVEECTALLGYKIVKPETP